MKTALGIRGRLILGFFAITLLFLIAVGITLTGIANAKAFASKVTTIDIPIYDSLGDLINEVNDTQIASQNYILSNDPQTKIKINHFWENISNHIATLDNLISMSENNISDTWINIKSSLSDLKASQLKLLETSDKTLATQILNSEVSPLFTRVINLLNVTNADNLSTAILDKQSKQLKEDTKLMMNGLNTVQMIEYILSVVGILVAIMVASFTARSILKHINMFRQHSSRIASGDLTKSIVIDSNDEMGQLGHDLNAMTQSLSTIAKEITQSCHNMVATLEEVRHAVDAQSAGASEQASSVNQITASLSEIEKSSSQTMEKAKSLGEAAERTREKGQLGLEAVDQSVNGMTEVREKVQLIAQTILDLSHQTQQVGEITAVVNNLAQQSKMLALNASIEAAKAGEAGKGFAVVAVEVKNLAEQSEQATAQVQKILEDIRHAAEKAVMVTEEGTKGVDHGTDLVAQTGDIIRNLNDVIHETTIASQQIESAVRQESAGIEQITTGMNEINQVTASFVESVKQTTEAIANLATIAKNLKTYVDIYKL